MCGVDGCASHVEKQPLNKSHPCSLVLQYQSITNRPVRSLVWLSACCVAGLTGNSRNNGHGASFLLVMVYFTYIIGAIGPCEANHSEP